MAIEFKGAHFIEFDTLLSDGERLDRDSTRKFIEPGNTASLRRTPDDKPLVLAVEE